jgi:D-lyxose ketol-isomerase
MLTKTEYDIAAFATATAFKAAGIRITKQEEAAIEVADFSLSDLKNVGLQILTYVNTDRVCAKEMYLSPYQTCPEHRHPGGEGFEGKEETFRCRRGEVYLYVSGTATAPIQAKLPPSAVTVFHEIVLHEGDQYTLVPNTLHWFQSGRNGAIVSEFSTKSRDESDVFTDTRIKRAPEVQ